MNSYDVAHSLKLGQLLGVMREECHADAPVSLLKRLRVVMHGGIDNFQKLPVEIFLGMRTRGINYDSIQIIELSVAKARVGELRINSFFGRLLVRLLGCATGALRIWQVGNLVLIFRLVS